MTRVIICDEEGRPLPLETLYQGSDYATGASPRETTSATGASPRETTSATEASPRETTSNNPNLPLFGLFDVIQVPRSGAPGSFERLLVFERLWIPGPQGFDLHVMTRPIKGPDDRRRALEDKGYLRRGHVASTIVTRR
jgi:hypothetical protein